jgi:hypothetical protein
VLVISHDPARCKKQAVHAVNIMSVSDFRSESGLMARRDRRRRSKKRQESKNIKNGKLSLKTIIFCTFFANCE